MPSKSAITKLLFSFLFLLLFNNYTLQAQNILDASIEQLTSPLAPHNNELKLVKIRIKNKGNVAISSVSIKWKINGVFQTTNTSTNISIPAASSLNINPTAELTMPVSTIPDNITNVYEFYIERVNGLLSTITSNDTLRVQFTAPISGTKTIGATASDYKTIADALNAMRYNGIAGDLKFRIKQGKYHDPIILLASELHFSNTINPKIQFESFSNFKDVEIITDKTIKSSVLFNGIKNATVRNLKIKNTCEFIGIGIQYFNQANNGLVYNCEVIVDSFSNVKAFAGICLGDITAAPNYSIINLTKVNYTRVSNCKIRGGTYGIIAAATNTILDTLNQIDSNDIKGVSHYGILAQYQVNLKINKNKIVFRHSPDLKSAGIHLNNAKTILPGIITVSQNYIRGAGYSGIYLLDVLGIGFPQNRLVDLSNNMIAGGFTSTNTILLDVPKGIFLMNSGSINVYFNSVVMDAPVNRNAVDRTSSLFLLGTPSLGIINVLNNNLINRNAGYAYYNASATGQSPVLSTDHNNYWVEKLDTNTATTSGFAYWDSAVRIGLQALQVANNRDKKSISLNPQFLSDENLHTYSPALDQKGSTSATTTVGVDYDGELRDQFGNPDIGADEVYPGGEDFAILDVNPKVFKLNQPNPWQIKLAYYGPTNGNTTLYYRYKIDGVEMLLPDSAIAIANVGLTNYTNITLNVPSKAYINRTTTNSFNLTVYIYAGNIGDLRPLNDTLSLNICVGMDGLYTLDPNGTGARNFLSFTDLFNKLQCGIAGPTTIEIAEGTYNERLVVGDIPNTSEINKLTFISKTRNPYKTVIVAAEGTESRHATIMLNGAKHIVIKNLTIENKASNYGSAIQLTGNSKYNIIENNLIKLDTINGSTSANLNAIVSTKLGTSTTNKTGINASYNTIRNNRISGGYYGIALAGLDTNFQDYGNVIESNTITGFQNTAIYSTFSNATILNNLIIRYKKATSSTIFGIQLNGLGDRLGNETIRIDGNKIIDINFAGISLANCLGFKNPSIKKYTFVLSNNMVGGEFKSSNGNAAGLLIQSCTNIMLVHNSILINPNRTPSSTPSEAVPRCLRVLNTCNEIEAHNNIFYSTNGAVPIEYYVKSGPGGLSNTGLVASNNNLFFTSFEASLNTPLILIIKNTNISPTKTLYSFNQISQSPFTALADFRANATNVGRETKSVAFPINFINMPNDLHTYDFQIDGLANKSYNIQTDIDKQKRALLADIGADEAISASVDLETTSISNKVFSITKPNVIKADFSNRGKNDLVNKQAILIYTLRDLNNNIVSSSADTVNLNLPVSKTYSHSFKKALTLSAGSIYTICAESIIIDDTITFNNITCKEACIGTEGDIYVGFSKSNPIAGTDTTKYFNTITAALQSISCGISGETTIYLNPLSSPYIERISIPKYELSIDNPMLNIKPYNTTNINDVVIKNTTSGSQDYLHYTIQLNGANNVSLYRLTIKNESNDFGSVIHFTNNAQNNIIHSCVLESKSNASGDLFYGIAFTSDAKLNITDPLALGNTGSNNKILNNAIYGGTAGIAMLGTSDLENTKGNIIINNYFSNFSKYGIFTKFSSDFEIIDNLLTPNTLSSTLIKSIAIYNANSGGIINGNNLMNMKSEGIKVLSVYANAQKPLLISNNFITSNIIAPIQDSTGVFAIKKSSYVYIYNNSVRYNGVNFLLNLSKDSVYVSSQGRYIYSDINNINVINNIFRVDSPDFVTRKPYVIYYNSNSTTNTINYNAYYSEYNNLFARTQNATYTTLQNWRTASAKDVNSIYQIPLYTTYTDLNLNNPVLFTGKGIPLGLVPKDIFENIRNPRVGSLGAIEYYTSNRNLSVFSLGNTNLTYGQNEISCYLINDGQNNISADTVALEYSVDTGNTWLGYQLVKLDSLTSAYKMQHVTFNLKYFKNDYLPTPLAVRINPLKRLSNDLIDTLEKIEKTFCIGVEGGEYLLSKTNTNADFKSIQEALQALKCGFANNVTITMDAGIYEEDLFFDNLPSLSTKSLTFKAANNANVVWKTLSPTRKNIVELGNCENISFQNITFESNRTTDFVAIHLLDSIDNIKFLNCKFVLPINTIVNQVYALSTLNTNAFTRSKVIRNIRIENCEFIGGSVGVNIKSNHQAAKNIDIIHSMFRSQYNTAININASNVDSISYNTISLNKTNTSTIGIKLTNLKQPFILSNNTILNCADESVLIDSASSINPSYIVNNMMASSDTRDGVNSNLLSIKNFGVNYFRGVFKSDELIIAFNSLSQTETGAISNQSTVLNFDKSNNIVCIGNIATNFDKSYALKFNTGIFDSTEFKLAKYNLLYTNGSTLAQWRTINCNTLVQLAQQDGGTCPFNIQNSPKGLGSFAPNFKSKFDLHANDSRINNAINTNLNLAILLKDIDAEVFDPLNTDIGCDQFNLEYDLAVNSFIEPVENQSFLGDNIEVKVLLENKGLDLPFVNIKYSIDGKTIDSLKYTFSPNLKTDSTFMFTFSKKYATLKPGVHVAKVFAEVREQRGAVYEYVDFNKVNDTLSVQFITIDSADLRVQNFINPVANATITSPTNVVLRIANSGSATVSNYKVVLKRNNVLQKEVEFIGVNTIAPNFFRDVPIDFTITPSDNNTYEYCAYTILFEDFNHSNDTSCISISTAVGINTIEASLLQVYPNPVKDVLMFNLNANLENANIKIYNTLGQLMHETALNNNELSVATLPKGVYQFVIDGSQRFRGTFIKE